MLWWWESGKNRRWVRAVKFNWKYHNNGTFQLKIVETNLKTHHPILYWCKCDWRRVVLVVVVVVRAGIWWCECDEQKWVCAVKMKHLYHKYGAYLGLINVFSPSKLSPPSLLIQISWEGGCLGCRQVGRVPGPLAKMPWQAAGPERWWVMC